MVRDEHRVTVRLLEQLDAVYLAWRAGAIGEIDTTRGPALRENVRFALAAVDPREGRMMVGENAATLYGFDLETLRPAAEAVGITPTLVARPLEEIPADSTCITFQRAHFEQAQAAARPS